MWFRNKALRPPHRLRIKRNVLLRGEEKALRLSDVLLLRNAYELALRAKPELREEQGSPVSLTSVSEDVLREVARVYGESGLFKLMFMASAHNHSEFNHFFKPIAAGLELLRSVSDELDLKCDNAALPQSSDVAKFSLNVMQPSLSRKLYNPGRHHGYLVYGLGGPKILVSHPFQGIDGDTYDVYNNSVDVVTSLMQRGYDGTFLFLDYVRGLEYDVHGVPAWLLWFAIIAVHSDLVLFVKEYEGDFGDAQKMEIALTPDRIQKKIVAIPHDELTWATKPEMKNIDGYMYLGEQGRMSAEEFYNEEAKHAAPFIEEYANDAFPKDRLFCLGEYPQFAEYPLDHPAYGEPDEIGGVSRP